MGQQQQQQSTFTAQPALLATTTTTTATVHGGNLFLNRFLFPDYLHWWPHSQYT